MLIQSAIAALLVLGSALVFVQLLELDGPRPKPLALARPRIRTRPRGAQAEQPGLKKAA
jgi:hypothetical protein